MQIDSQYKLEALEKFNNFTKSNLLYKKNSPFLREVLHNSWTALACELDYNAKLTNNENDSKNMVLKLDHTLKVLDKTLTIIYGENFSSNEKLLLSSQISAIFHDISRFEQLRLFHTFNDAQSFNHSQHSVKILKEKHLLAPLDIEIQNCVLTSIEYHSGASLPEIEDENTLLCAKILRDADKLDILRIFSLYLDNPENSAIVYNFKDSGTLSKEVWQHLKNNTIPPYTIMKSSIDYLLSRMQWVYDFNFKTTCLDVKNSLFLEKIKSKLPASIKEVDIYYNRAANDLNNRTK